MSLSEEVYSWIKIRLSDLLSDRVLYKNAFELLKERDSSDIKGTTKQVANIYTKVIESVITEADAVDSDLLIKLTRIAKDDFNDEEYIDVALYSERNEESYAMDFTSWSSLAGMYVVLGKDTELSKSQMLAEVLWEITFWGFSVEDIEAEKQKLIDSVSEVERGNCISFYSFGELEEHMDSSDE